ncbi:MAG TPA: alternative ribosome rescue aminoacyl-tRNA hydrolase ArfB [Ignavibacteria bacterium]|nr:alternative ribosome rescue aminoacyl-tRNA hydrolase ArfB [Ignavibacteria bacterium]
MTLKDRNFENEFEFKSSRSGGKGGQNVNKVETKIELNFNVVNSSLLDEVERYKLLLKLKDRIDKNGILKIVSQTERSQFLNKSKAIDKFYLLTDKALEEEKIRKKAKLTKAEKEKRLSEKKKLSVKKVSRKINSKEFDS